MKTSPSRICYRVLTHQRLPFSSSAFMLVNSLCFNSNVFVEKMHAALKPKEVLSWISEKADGKQPVIETHSQAVPRLLLLDNIQNYCCREFSSSRAPSFVIFLLASKPSMKENKASPRRSPPCFQTQPRSHPAPSWGLFPLLFVPGF